MPDPAFLHEVVGVPSSDVGRYLARTFTAAWVHTPALGSCLVWLELYEARAYPMVYYTAATFSRIR